MAAAAATAAAHVGQLEGCEDCGQRAAEVMCAMCRGRFCGACSDRIHSGGVMRTHPVRLLEQENRRRSSHAINSSALSPRSAAELRKLEGKYDKVKERCKTLKLDWAKLGETTKLLQQAEQEKSMLKEYIKKLEVENDGLRGSATAGGGGGGGVVVPNAPHHGGPALPRAWATSNPAFGTAPHQRGSFPQPSFASPGMP